MITRRVPLIPFVFACLLWSVAVFSDNGPVVDDAVAEKADDIQLAMLKDAQQPLHADQGGDAVDDSSADDSQPFAGTGAERTFDEAELVGLRVLFQQAEVALSKRHDTDYFQLASRLKEYPLYPYLQYQWLKKHLGDERQVTDFLQQHASSRYAGILKRQWLFHLAKKDEWQTFLQYYDKTSDASLSCYYHRAQFNTGDQQAALEGAKELWVVGHSQPKACDPLFEQLKASSLFNADLFWQRFDAALRNNKTQLAKYVTKFMSVQDQKTASLWLKLHRNPEQYLPELFAHNDMVQAPSMFSHAISRLAGSDVNQAIELWDDNKVHFAVSKEQVDRVEKRLAMQLAFDNDPSAYDRLSMLGNADYSSKSWRIRVALYEQNWPRVITAIEDLSDTERKQEKWQYWLARAFQETGKPLHTEELLSELSEKRDFYGYLAADRLDQSYQLSDKPIEVTAQEISNIENREEFRVAHEFRALDKDTCAKLQWWHAVRQLSETEIPVAAKLAQQWQWDEIAILTIAKAKSWDDIELRFPLSYADKIQRNAERQNLSPVILYGMIRRESVFNKNAHSPAGARGLMQLMPQTARQMARDLSERWSGKSSLYEPDKNIQYGSLYYQKLLNQFDGHYALALAAYNAGPAKVKQWLPDKAMPADIWIETIPFHETRNYVTSVLVYAMIYQQRLQSSELTLNDLTPDVRPSRNNELTMNDFTPEVRPSRDYTLN